MGARFRGNDSNNMSKKISTSWSKGAEWYDETVSRDDSYQNKVILPNLLRLMEIKPGEKILDVGCGTGFFAAEFSKAGAKVYGIDVGEELLAIARKNAPKVEFKSASADALPFGNEIFDKVVFVLSLQNMADMKKAVSEAVRTLKSGGHRPEATANAGQAGPRCGGGKIFLVLNHPAFRIPGESSWGWDPAPERCRAGSGCSGIQYRRIDSYLSEKKSKIQMHPGDNPSDVTWSFHVPLQYYFKLFNKNGLVVERLEEWTSHTKTPTGPRAEAENRARAEFPLFLALVTCLTGRQVDKI